MWTTISGDISASTGTPGLLTVTGIQGNMVPAPTGSSTVLTWSGSMLMWSAGLTGTIPVTQGGTGLTTLTAHGVLVGEGTSNVALVGPGALGTILIGGGASADPSFLAAGSAHQTLHANGASSPTWSLLALTTDVSGMLPVANGGTGASTLTQYNILAGNGTGAIDVIAPGTSGYVLTSNGASAFPTFQAGGGASPITWAGDLAGSSNSTQEVSALTAYGGSTISVKAYLTFVSTQSNAGVFQAPLYSSSPGTPLYFYAQNNTLTGLGGDLNFSSGFGHNTEGPYYSGDIKFSLGGNNPFLYMSKGLGTGPIIPNLTFTASSGYAVPGLGQDALVSGTGQTMYLLAQNVTTGTGGALWLSSGSGTDSFLYNAGWVTLALGGAPWFGFGTPGGFLAGFYLHRDGLDITAGGTFTLTATQYASPYIVITCTSSVSATVVFPNVQGLWLFDIGTVATQPTITVQSGTQTLVVCNSTIFPTEEPTQTILWIQTTGGNGISATLNTNIVL